VGLAVFGVVKALRTDLRGGSEYVRITVDYPVAAAKAFSTLSDKFKFVYVSGRLFPYHIVYLALVANKPLGEGVCPSPPSRQSKSNPLKSRPPPTPAPSAPHSLL
jgi:hypothetical protein